MLVVIREWEIWRYLLEDAKFKFEVWIDHKNLKHILGVRVGKPDRLSRRLNLKVGIKKNNNK